MNRHGDKPRLAVHALVLAVLLAFADRAEHSMDCRGGRPRLAVHALEPPAFPAVASTALATSSREAGRPLCRPAGRSAQQPAARGAKGNRPGWDERGSGTVYALGVIAVLLAAVVGIAGLIQAQSAAGRARAAADLAAISGATVLSSVIAPGDPCAMAQRVAAANGASVSACSVAGEDVTVSVVVPTTILGLPRQASARARAGPVDAPPKP